MSRTLLLRVAWAGVVLMGGWKAASAAPGDPPDGKVFIGYLYGSPRDVNFSLYTHLCQAFLTADADGSLRNPEQYPNRELTTAAHKAGVKVLLSLGGWGWDDQFAAIVSNPAAEARYVQAVMAIIAEYDYDGIDLDWEYPDTKEEVVGFERLSRTFRRELDALGAKTGRPMLLTMAASSNAGTLRWLETPFLLETMDWINVMTYDYAGDWTSYAGHNSPLFPSSKVPGGRGPSIEATMNYLLQERKMPPNRLAVGLPLYGRAFAVKAPYEEKRRGEPAPRVRLPRGDYRNLHQLLNTGGWTRHWDDETKTPWLLSPDGNAVVGYDDVESLAIKTAWAMKQDFRGVFFWQIAGDRLPDGSNPLQEASHRAWEAGKGAPSR
jgi:chitinase